MSSNLKCPSIYLVTKGSCFSFLKYLNNALTVENWCYNSNMNASKTLKVDFCNCSLREWTARCWLKGNTVPGTTSQSTQEAVLPDGLSWHTAVTHNICLWFCSFKINKEESQKARALSFLYNRSCRAYGLHWECTWEGEARTLSSSRPR